MKIFNRFYTPLLVFLFCGTTIFAQQTETYISPQKDFYKGVELYQHQQYLQAQQAFQQFLKTNEPYYGDNKLQVLKSDATFYNAVCGLYLNEPDVEYLLKNFLAQYPNTTRANDTKYYLGKFNFQKNQLKDVILYLEQVDHNQLSAEESMSSKFYLAYSYFFTKKQDKAKPLFEQLAASKNDFFYPSNYYAGYIAFNKKNYDDALKYFEKVKTSPSFEKTVPYFICQIYFNQKKYEQLLSYANEVLAKDNLQNKADINYLVGQTYFQQKDYDRALPFLTTYAKENKRMRKEDLYQLAFAQYQTKQYKDAIENLKDLNVLNDSLGQYALYMLGDCYIKTHQTTNARNAFSKAAKLNFDSSIKEKSSFNAAKLAYEDGLDQQAITGLQDFIKTFSTSDLQQEAKELLTDIYVNTNNYKEAISLIESFETKTPKLKEAYQKAAFSRGVELYHDRLMKESYSMFEKSLTYPINNQYVAEADFWKGEILFQQNNPEKAIGEYNKYLSIDALESSKNSSISKTNALYNVAYCYLKLQNYESALQNFKSCLASTSGKSRLTADVNLRMADCYFTGKDYVKATQYYDEVITNRQTGSDYALFQKGIILGLTNDNEGKIKTLNEVGAVNPKSIYIDDAKFEIGNTYFNEEKYSEAEVEYQDLISNYPKSSFYKKARMKLALVYINAENNDKALATYQDMIKDFPNSNEATEALLGVKNIYIDKGDASGFLNYLTATPNAQLSASAEDSLMYEAAESNFNNQKCDEAIANFDSYLQKFPKGFFQLNAVFMRAECNFKKGNTTKAYQDYAAVAAMTSNKFTERSLVKCSNIAYNNLKDYNKAYDYFQQLADIASYKNNKAEAVKGAMRSAYKINNKEQCSRFAQKVLADETASDDEQKEAHFYLGKMAFDANDFATAKTELSACVKKNKNENAAEANFLLAKIKYNEKDLVGTEAACYENINQTPSYDKWVGESLLLMAQVYTDEKEYFQAKSTLETLKESTNDANLISRADAKLKEVKAMEEADSKLQTDTLK